MDTSGAVRFSAVIGVLFLGVGIYSIRSQVNRTDESVKDRVSKVTTGARLTFMDPGEEEIVHDFGSVTQSRPVSYDFVFTNDGVVDARIERIETTRGAIDVLDYTENTLPGGEGKIVVELDPYGLSGQQEGVVQIETNDVETPTRKILVTAEIQ